MTIKNAITIVAFGDSITEAVQQKIEDRWPEILRRTLQARFPGSGIIVVNAGVGGNTSREGLKRIEQDVLRHKPQFVLVEFGNDATPDPDRHVAFNEFTANLDSIRTKVAQSAKGRIVLLTFPPIIDQWHGHYLHEFYQKNGGQDVYQEHYRELTRQFACANAVALIDLDRAMRQAMALHGPQEYILKDGVHLTAQGNHLVANLVFEFLKPEFDGLLANS